MDIFSLYVDMNEGLVRWADISHPEAHMHAGLAIYVLVQVLLRTRRASGIALQAVIGAELLNEIMERAHYGSWRWDDTLADVALTIFWPTVLYLMATWRRQRWSAWQRTRRASRPPVEADPHAWSTDGHDRPFRI